MRPRITAVVVDYRQAGNVRRGVASLQRQYDRDRLDIVIVDNSESRENVEHLRSLVGGNVSLIVNDENLGYPGGCNRGAAAARGDFLLLVNPDIQWHEDGALDRLVDFMTDDPTLAVAGPRQLNEDGSAPLTARAFPTMRAQVLRRTPLRGAPPFSWIVAAYEQPRLDYGRSQAVPWIQSSCVLVRRDFWFQAGGFDERFFLFMADVDLCHRAWASGQSVWICAESAVTASGRRASAGGAMDLLHSPALRHHVADATRYYWKHGRSRPEDRFAGIIHDARREEPAPPSLPNSGRA